MLLLVVVVQFYLVFNGNVTFAFRNRLIYVYILFMLIYLY